ncbi:MAG: hypothetical protein GX256_03350 [Fretibacterium sp.]|nr:hypothetical protein [Fretibacterium sp.]
MTTASDRATWNTQKLDVLRHLQAGHTLTQDEARALFGIMRLASRIEELRREGWNIVTEMIPVGQNGAKVGRYSLSKEEPRRESPYLPVAAENIPDELKALPQWVVWHAVKRGGKMTKQPYQVSGHSAKVNDPATWTTFDRAFEAYEAGGAEGVGFVFAQGGGIVGVDLDTCVQEDGELHPKAQLIVEALGSYTEYSVSGKGIHVLVRAELARGKRNGPIEIYPHNRYFTVTGSIYEDRTELTSNQQAIDALVEAISLAKKKGKEPIATAGGFQYLGNDALIEKAKNAKNGEKFSRLWEGGISDYPSHSEANLALLSMLLYWTNGDEDRAAILFEQSALCREKWTERADYRRFCFDRLRKGATA